MSYDFLGFQDGYLNPDDDVLWKELDLDRRIEYALFLFANGVVMADCQRVKNGLEELMIETDISCPPELYIGFFGKFVAFIEYIPSGRYWKQN